VGFLARVVPVAGFFTPNPQQTDSVVSAGARRRPAVRDFDRPNKTNGMFSMIVDVLHMLGILLPVAVGFVFVTPFGWVFLAVTGGVIVLTISQVLKRKKLSIGKKLLLVAWFLYSL
jgi:hypothetical protein